MFEPVRGGTRGGQAEFKWTDVSADKDRENYLGHSINAPTGRWQKNKDIHWYNREARQTSAEREEEIRKIKETEAEALAAALGFAAGPKAANPSGPGTGANAIGVAPKAEDVASPSLSREAEKEEKRRHKEERRREKEEKRAQKEKKRAERHAQRHAHSRTRTPDEDDEDYRSRHRHRSRSRSPYRSVRDEGRGKDSGRYGRQSRTPPARRPAADYGEQERERERERDRRRWEDNARRDRPGASRGRG